MDNFPARLHVLFASNSPLAVVFRRGPSKRVASLLWGRRTDEFQLGQWFKGKIYARRSDLSPDGQHLIYFALGGKWDSTKQGGSWTAISEAPYITAHSVYLKGNTYNGGGLWTSNTSFWLNEIYPHSVLRENPRFKRDTSLSPPRIFGNEDLSVYYLRLLRDGWKFVATSRARLREEISIAEPDKSYLRSSVDIDIFEKPISHGWIVRKLACSGINKMLGKGSYWDEHELVHPESGKSFSFPNWEWAEVDGKRIVWATGGCLFSGILSSGELAEVTELYNFNSMTFETVKAPYDTPSTKMLWQKWEQDHQKNLEKNPKKRQKTQKNWRQLEKN